MSLQTRRELLNRIRDRYHQATWKEKSKILNEFISISGYQRKYAISLLNRVEISKFDPSPQTVHS